MTEKTKQKMRGAFYASLADARIKLCAEIILHHQLHHRADKFPSLNQPIKMKLKTCKKSFANYNARSSGG